MRRSYYLDGKEINSSDCNGFLHVARHDKPVYYDCLSCFKPIKAREEYIILNIYGSPACHKACYISDHNNNEKIILGIKIETRSLYGIKRKAVICKEFVVRKEGDD